MRRISQLPVIMQRAGMPVRSVALALSDLAAFVGTMFALLMARAAFGGLDPALYHWVFPLLLVAPFLGSSLGLYRSISLPPHREMKAVFLFVSLLYALILLVLFLSKTGDLYSRLVIFGGWAATLVTLPLLRAACIRIFSRLPWWSSPLIILGSGARAKRLWHYLRRHPQHGLRPVAMLDLSGEPEEVDALLGAAARNWPGGVALLMHGAGERPSADYVSAVSRHFAKVLVVPDLSAGFRRYWLTPCELSGVTMLLLTQNLHDWRRLAVKRAIDILFCILLAPLVVPLGLVLALLIRLDSPGSPLYRQTRLGRNGRLMHVYKFRTMVADADAKLKEWLARDPELQAEWERDHKLKHDPRITRMGRFLRKTSLDELPQLLNVALGDMSLVGPRPIVGAEVKKYGPVYDEYRRVRPGVTGLWQISGRNNTTYAERVAFDHYYINNWSVWMDLWILAKTVPVVLTGYGAY
ncbi:MAG: undecaprenyl-phosphate galactose phosphotransferase WbaP [Desulfovibrio sp.]|uniref:undecaprenyl-phosphate galactose phosphotransferase WbaP n=1 Tax=Desulfovibrio sp. TaxID=885 RepID=UPI001A70C4FF|nr:undecaprenyl-phosphate galactose phosphotransferase WbaP [Desulfovibrio sp.]MBD5417264.1 undecaprenyl-phosphate galactose phosphotransferase WbaP [Desulfovibrio sp.]